MRVKQARRAALLIVFVTMNANAHEGWGIVIHEMLGVVVADIPANTVWRVSDGRGEALIHGVHSHALVIGGDGAIYGTNPEPDGTRSSVWRIDSSRRFSHVVPPATNYALGLQSFLITRDGTIYSANRYDSTKPSVVLLAREPSGAIRRMAGPFISIDGMSEDPDGNLIIADGPFVRSVTRDGRVRALGPALSRRRWGEDLLGISRERNGYVHLADFAGRRVLRVSVATGEAHEVLRSAFLWAPTGVEVKNDLLYVLEHIRPPLSILGDLQLGPYLRVRRVASDGSSRTLMTLWGHRSPHAALVVLVLIVAAAFFYRRTR